MKLVVRAGERDHVVEVGGAGLAVLDGKPIDVDLIGGDQGLLSLLIEGKAYTCDVETRKGNQLRLHIGQSVFDLEVLDERQARRQVAARGIGTNGTQVIVAPMPGKVVRLLVKVGQTVKAGEGLVVIEAMKMENELRSTRDGTVKEISVLEGVAVEGGAKLCVVA